MATAEQRARFGNYKMTPVGAKHIRQPTAEQRARFTTKPSFSPSASSAPQGRYPGLQEAIAGGALSGGRPQAQTQQAMTASTGIQPPTPYTQSQVNAAESALRNAQVAMPSMPGTNFGAGGALSSILNSATGALGNMAATQFGGDASAALNQYGLGAQQAQANALQGWQNMNANQLSRDMNFNRQRQNWLLRFINQNANSPEFYA